MIALERLLRISLKLAFQWIAPLPGHEMPQTVVQDHSFLLSGTVCSFSASEEFRAVAAGPVRTTQTSHCPSSVHPSIAIAEKS